MTVETQAHEGMAWAPWGWEPAVFTSVNTKNTSFVYRIFLSGAWVRRVGLTFARGQVCGHRHLESAWAAPDPLYIKVITDFCCKY